MLFMARKYQLILTIKNSKVLVSFYQVFIDWRRIYVRITFETARVYSACERFTKYREGIQKFRETDNLKHLN